MTTRLVFVLVVLVAVRCSTTSIIDDDDGTSSESWTEWAKDKISEGLGFRAEDTTLDKTKDKVADTSKHGYDAAKDTATGSGQYVADKSSEMKEKAASDVKRRAKDIEEEAEENLSWAKEKAKEGYESAKHKAEAAKDAIASNLQTAKDESREIKDDDILHRDEEL